MIRDGSSPLARGLRERLQIALEEGRIIPARAGFTPVSTLRFVSSTDHPRSRGVYTMGRRRLPEERGSSPLARGLRQVGDARRRLPRIIPARAGFTP